MFFDRLFERYIGKHEFIVILALTDCFNIFGHILERNANVKQHEWLR